jgi:dienelactone hydrolase
MAPSGDGAPGRPLATHDVRVEQVQYRCGPLALTGVLALPGSGSARGGVLLVHEASGLGGHVQRRAEQLAELGYAAFAADMFGAGPAELPLAAGQEKVQALLASPGQITALLRSALETMRGRAGIAADRVAVVGYCFGGSAALELARGGEDVAAVVCFHGRLSPLGGARTAPLHPRVLVVMGSQDPMIPAATIEGFAREMDQAEADWQLVLLGGAKHAFTDVDAGRLRVAGVEHSPTADRRSWNLLISFLDEELS